MPFCLYGAYKPPFPLHGETLACKRFLTTRRTLDTHKKCLLAETFRRRGAGSHILGVVLYCEAIAERVLKKASINSLIEAFFILMCALGNIWFRILATWIIMTTKESNDNTFFALFFKNNFSIKVTIQMTHLPHKSLTTISYFLISSRSVLFYLARSDSKALTSSKALAV